MSIDDATELEGITTENLPGLDLQQDAWRRGAAGPRSRRLPRALAALAALLVAASVGCAGNHAPGGRVDLREGTSPSRAEAPGGVFPTLESAALAALEKAQAEAVLADRGRLRIGTIQRVANGFRYSPPLRSRETVHSMASMKIRYRLGPDDVATYVVHPRSGRTRIDRMNEAPTAREKRLVDEMDPRHRPLYVLTPSLKVVRYFHGRTPITIVHRDDSDLRLRSAMHAQ